MLLVEDRRQLGRARLSPACATSTTSRSRRNPQDALFRAAEGNYDLVIVSLNLADFDALRLCSQLRSLERTRAIPILLIADVEDRPRILRGLDLGVNDYIVRPIDRNELVARVRTQMRRKRYADSLRDNVQAAIELAVVDPLTGLNNRRYLETHLASALDQAAHKGRPLSLMILDIDHFKSVNDTYGHDAGDEVLKHFRPAHQASRARRRSHLPARRRGIRRRDAGHAAGSRRAHRRAGALGRRARALPASTRKRADDPGHHLDRPRRTRRDANPDALLRRADKALYRSKTAGRNRVTAAAA